MWDILILKMFSRFYLKFSLTWQCCVFICCVWQLEGGGEGVGRRGRERGHGGRSKYVPLTLPSGLCTEYKECFSLYDKQQRGKIKATDLMVVMRCLGASPTPGEVQRHLLTHGIGEWAGPEWLVGGECTIWAGGWALSLAAGVLGRGPAGGGVNSSDRGGAGGRQNSPELAVETDDQVYGAITQAALNPYSDRLPPPIPLLPVSCTEDHGI